MNTLFVNPIIIPSPINSVGMGGYICMNVLWAVLIVFNAISLISFGIALFIKWRKNSESHFKWSLKEILNDHTYLDLGVYVPIGLDFVAITEGLIYWVSTLL